MSEGMTNISFELCNLSLTLNRVTAGFGVGQASVAVPLMISEHAPRAIRGALTGFYQLSITSGIMLAFWVDYGSLIHLRGDAQWIVPLSMQALPACLLFFGMLLCYETPRHLARKGDRVHARLVLATVRNLPLSHPYIEREFGVICDQLDRERALDGDSFRNLIKELYTVPSNRRRGLVSIGLMISQQMTGRVYTLCYMLCIDEVDRQFRYERHQLLRPYHLPQSWS